MNNLYRRLHENRGETLIESMAAILIFTFASILLLTMLSAAKEINHTAAQWDASRKANMELAEMAEQEAVPATVEFVIHGKREAVAVEVFGDGPYAYYPVREGTPE